MATIYVKPNGDNTKDGKTLANAVATIARGCALVRADDSLIVKAGTYTDETYNGSDGLNVSDSIQYLAEAGVKIDQLNNREYGFIVGNKDDVVIDGFEIYNCGACISGRGINLTIQNCHLHDCSSNGISINGGGDDSTGLKTWGADLVWILNNHVHHCAVTAGSRSGISVLMCVTSSRSAPEGNIGVKILGNIVHHVGKMSGNETDGNAIICDKWHHWKKVYTRKGYVGYNICYNNAGGGCKTMSCEDIHFDHNTCFNNTLNDGYDISNWSGELYSMYSYNCKWTNNIGCATSTHTRAFGSFNSRTPYNGSDPSKTPRREGNHTWQRNIFWNTANNGSIVDNGSNGMGQLPLTTGTPPGYTAVNPAFTAASITAGTFIPTAAQALGTATDGTNIGAYQGTVTPVVNVTPLTAPIVVAADFASGGTYTVTPGTYTGTPIVDQPAIAFYKDATGTFVPVDNPIGLAANPLAFTNASKVVTVTVPSTAGWAVNQWVTILYAAAAGGLTIDGGYRIKTIPDATHITIEAAANATSTVAAGGGTAVKIIPSTLGKFPVFAADTLMRIKENYTGQGVTGTAGNRSDEITVKAATATLTPPTNTVAPAVPAEAPTVGVALSASQGTWGGNPAPTLHGTTPYQWYRCQLVSPFNATAISGANGASYTPVTADISYGLACDVKMVNSQNTVGVVARSNITAAVVATSSDYTITEATAKIKELRSAMDTMTTNYNTLLSTVSSNDTAVRALVTALTTRVGLNETSISDLLGRMGVAESKISDLRGDLDDTRLGINEIGQRTSIIEFQLGLPFPESPVTKKIRMRKMI